MIRNEEDEVSKKPNSVLDIKNPRLRAASTWKILKREFPTISVIERTLIGMFEDSGDMPRDEIYKTLKIQREKPTERLLVWRVHRKFGRRTIWATVQYHLDIEADSVLVYIFCENHALRDEILQNLASALRAPEDAVHAYANTDYATIQFRFTTTREMRRQWALIDGEDSV